MNPAPAIATARTKSRLTLLALLAVFLLPLLLAWLFARGPLDWRPQSNLNYGVLLQPPLALSSYGVIDATGAALTENAIARDWFVVVLYDGACYASCQQLMQDAERIQIAVGRDTHRVSLALLSAQAEAATPAGKNWRLPAQGGLIQELRRASGDPPFDTQLLLVDYLGNVVLIYPPTDGGLGALEDLKRLLKSAAT